MSRYRPQAAVFPLLMVLASVAPAAAQRCKFPGPWTRVEPPAQLADGGPLVPIRIAADPSVIRRNGRYEMFFTTAGSNHVSGIARAESSDGKIWSVWRAPVRPDALTDLVLPTPPHGWEAPGIETADVLIGPDGLWRMYYTGNRPPLGSATYAIGLATSLDGITWTRRTAPVLEPENDWEKPICSTPSVPTTCQRGGVLEPSVLYDPTTKLYRMYYSGLGEPKNSFRTFRIGMATSPDGITWTRRPQPVFHLGAPGRWDEMWTSHVNVVADPGGGYHMFYFGSAPSDYREGVELQRGSIGHAFSSDGLSWQRNPGNPILSPRPGQADEWQVGGPSAVIEDQRIRLFHFGSRTGGLVSDILLAEAPCP